MSTTDGGMHWKKLSPDLGYPKGDDAAAARLAAAVAVAAVAAAVPAVRRAGGSIESFSPSSVAAGIIWVGTNNGLDQGHARTTA